MGSTAYFIVLVLFGMHILLKHALCKIDLNQPNKHNQPIQQAFDRHTFLFSNSVKMASVYRINNLNVQEYMISVENRTLIYPLAK